MDFNKLTTGDWVLGGSGIVLFISSFLTWFKIDFGGIAGLSSQTYTETGWDYFFTGIVPVLLGLALIGYVVVTKLLDDVKLPEMPVGWPLVVLGVAGLAALLVILRLLIGGDDRGTDVLERSYGLFIATVAALGLVGGAFLKFQEDGGDLSDIKKGTSSGSGAAGQGGAPTPF